MTKIKMVYDTDLKRPACVLLQVVMGGDDDACGRLFDAQDWLVSPTPGMKLLEATLEQWKQVVAITERNRHAGKDRTGNPLPEATGQICPESENSSA